MVNKRIHHKLIIIRHAHAENREKFKKNTGKSDNFRPITLKGKEEIQKIAKFLRQIEPGIDLVLTSPYTRAQQTAKVLAKNYKNAEIINLDNLMPHSLPQATLQSLKKINNAGVIAIVGHEPHLSIFLSFILTGSTRSYFDIKKSGFAIVEFLNIIEKRKATLKCLIQPSQVTNLVKS